jgi:hypothetical protein
MNTFLDDPTVSKWLTFIDSRLGLEPVADGIRTVQAIADNDYKCSPDDLDAIATALTALMELAVCPGKLETLYTANLSQRLH